LPFNQLSRIALLKILFFRQIKNSQSKGYHSAWNPMKTLDLQKMGRQMTAMLILTWFLDKKMPV
jgi:hypothetical protein